MIDLFTFSQNITVLTVFHRFNMPPLELFLKLESTLNIFSDRTNCVKQ